MMKWFRIDLKAVEKDSTCHFRKTSSEEALLQTVEPKWHFTDSWNVRNVGYKVCVYEVCVINARVRVWLGCNFVKGQANESPHHILSSLTQVVWIEYSLICREETLMWAEKIKNPVFLNPIPDPETWLQSISLCQCWGPLSWDTEFSDKISWVLFCFIFQVSWTTGRNFLL